MAVRPSRLWKDMPQDKRLVAATAFWSEDQDDVQLQHFDAIATIARRLNFRAKSVQALPIERKAKHLSQLQDVSDAVATRALISYHFTSKRELMAAFLDALGIAHDNGLINEESVAPPPAEKLSAAIATVKQAFPAEDVDLYLRTLATLDGDTWAGVEAAMGS
jgi:hypothetical protein